MCKLSVSYGAVTKMVPWMEESLQHHLQTIPVVHWDSALLHEMSLFERELDVMARALGGSMGGSCEWYLKWVKGAFWKLWSKKKNGGAESNGFLVQAHDEDDGQGYSQRYTVHTRVYLNTHFSIRQKYLGQSFIYFCVTEC